MHQQSKDQPALPNTASLDSSAILVFDPADQQESVPTAARWDRLLTKRVVPGVLIANVLFVLVLFPYLTPVKTVYDTQPWTVFIAGLVFLALLARSGRRELFSWPMVLLFGFLVFAAATYLVRSDPWFGFRSLVGYASVPLIATVAIKSFASVSGKTFVGVVTVWFAVTLAQLFIDPYIAYELVPRFSNTIVRGVASLAPEPSALAVMAVMFSVLNEFFRTRGGYSPWSYKTVLAVAVFLAVASGTGTGLLLIGLLLGGRLAMLVTIDRKLQSFALTSVLGVLALSLVTGLPKLAGYAASIDTSADSVAAQRPVSPRATRGRDLLVQFIDDPWQTIVSDGSVGERLGHPALAARSLFVSNGLGYGLGTWNDHAEDLVASSPTWVQQMVERKFDLGGRILTGWGTPLFEMGLAGLAWVLLMFWILARPIFTRTSARPVTLYSFLVTVPLVAMAVALATPALGYVVGLHLLAARKPKTAVGSNLVQFETSGTSEGLMREDKAAA